MTNDLKTYYSFLRKDILSTLDEIKMATDNIRFYSEYFQAANDALDVINKISELDKKFKKDNES